MQTNSIKLDQLVEEPLVSILMPAFNVESFIDTAIESVLSQNYKNLELLILDDGSSDKTWSRISRWNSPKIRKFRFRENKGNVEAMNFLFKQSNGLYIGIQDADDWCAVDKVEKQVSFMQKNFSIVLCGTAYEYIQHHGKSDGPILVPQTHTQIIRFIETHNSPPVCFASIVFRKKILSEIGDFRSYFSRIGAADFDWYYRAIQTGEAANLQDVCYFYRMNLTSVTKTMTKDPRKEVSDKIAFFLYNERLTCGSDSLQTNNHQKLDKFLHPYLFEYKEDPSLIYRKIGYENVKKGFFIKALKHVLIAIVKNPIKKDNYSLLKFWCWKKFINKNLDFKNL